MNESLSDRGSLGAEVVDCEEDGDLMERDEQVDAADHVSGSDGDVEPRR